MVALIQNTVDIDGESFWQLDFGIAVYDEWLTVSVTSTDSGFDTFIIGGSYSTTRRELGDIVNAFDGIINSLEFTTSTVPLTLAETTTEPTSMKI